MRQSLQVQRERERKNEGDFASVPVGRFKLMILDLLYSSSRREIEGEERGDGTAAATNVATPRATSKAYSIINCYNVFLLSLGAGAANDAYCHHLTHRAGSESIPLQESRCTRFFFFFHLPSYTV